MARTSPTPVEKLTYEDALAELTRIVADLEAAERPLEEMIALFERGQALRRRCAELLERAELKVQILTADDPSEEPAEEAGDRQE